MKRWFIWIGYGTWLIAVTIVVTGLLSSDGMQLYLLPGWAFIALHAIPIVFIWILILRCRISLKWLLVAVLGALLFLVLGPICGVVSAIIMIGIIKFAIEAFGRRNVLAGSRVNVTENKVAVRGLVRYENVD